jgi:hypothetical protein
VPNEKRYFKSERNCKTSKNLEIYNIESNTDPKSYKTNIIKIENNYNGNNRINIKKNLYASMNSDKNLNFRINNELKKVNDYTKINHNSNHSKENHHRNNNLDRENKIIKNYRINHNKIYSSSFISNTKEEYKENNNIYKRYDKDNYMRPKNSFLSDKNVSSYFKINNHKPLNSTKYNNNENNIKQTKNKIYMSYSIDNKKEPLNTYNNLRNKGRGFDLKYNTLITENNDLNSKLQKYQAKINTTYINNMTSINKSNIIKVPKKK